MATDTPAIRVDDLVFEYPGQRALHGVSFTIDRGSVTALVGPNGAGKTTLMSCIAALQTPFSGRIHVHGVDMLEDPREGHRRLGYLKDFFGLYDALSVERTLWHAARSQGIAARDCPGAVARVAEQLDITHLMQRAAGQLSRGQRQRLAIARTLVHQPPVLLLDEPASGLDPEARHHLATLMRRLRDTGMTLLVSSHILSELAEYSTHMMILRDGRLLEQRALGAEDGRTWLRLGFAQAPGGIPDCIAAHPGVSGPHIEGGDIVLAFSGDAGARAALLKACVDGGLTLCAFGDLGTGLQDEYLRRVRAAPPRAGTPGRGP
jgi:ABC-2 type transport system ATP-binding protein